jgi:hypothetical protein
VAKIVSWDDSSPIPAAPGIQTSPRKTGESLREIKAIEYTCGTSAVVAGLGLYSYQVRELLAALVLFTVGFFFLSLVALGVFFIWYASEKVAIWTGPASRSMIALSRRLLVAYTRP